MYLISPVCMCKKSGKKEDGADDSVFFYGVMWYGVREESR